MGYSLFGWVEVLGFEFHHDVLGDGLVAADGDELAGDADGDFAGFDGADAEADGGVNAGELVGSDAIIFEGFVDADDLAAGANEADVLRLAAGDGGEGIAIVFVAAGDDHNVAVVVELVLLIEFGERLIDRADEAGGVRIRESVGIGVVGAVVDDGEVEVDGGGEFAEFGANVAGAGDDERGFGMQGVLDRDGLVVFVYCGEFQGGGL